MPEIICKIVDESGSERSFGPVQISKKAAAQIAADLEEPERRRLDALEKQRSIDAAEEQERRSLEAQAKNQARIDDSIKAAKAAAKGS